MGGRMVMVGLGVFAASSMGCVADGDEHQPGASGAAMFARYCARCHGEAGAGNFLKGMPPNRSTRLVREAIADRVLRGAAQHGRMPSFPKLSKADALALADHVLALREESGGRGVFWMNPGAPPGTTVPSER